MRKVVQGEVLVVGIASLLACLAYATGLSGPFLLDDQSNLDSIAIWLRGELGTLSLLFDRGAGTFGRPVSMATLATNAWLLGYEPFALKLGNLVVHVAAGWLLFGLARRLLALDVRCAPQAGLIASVIAAVWLLHPLNVSTVLYPVQRMAQMSSVFLILGLLVFVHVRSRFEQQAPGRSLLQLFALIPLLTALAFLSKENGALLPLLCGLVEYFFFRTGTRPRQIKAFFLVFLVVPAGMALLLLVLRPDALLWGYAIRDFTLPERLLTQLRVLVSYMGSIALPNPPSMGVYADDFAKSTGLLSPPSTLYSGIFLLLGTALALFLRSRLPAVAFGWCFFLCAHALESTILPLELYFEHRNYLPSFGLLMSMCALAAILVINLGALGVRLRLISTITSAALILILAASVHGRASIWSNERVMAEASFYARPNSLRANVAVMTSALRGGDLGRAREAIEGLLISPIPRNRAVAHAYRLMIECEQDGAGRSGDLQAFAETSVIPLTLLEQTPFDLIYKITDIKPCDPFSDADFGLALVQAADRDVAVTGGKSGYHTYLRHQAAMFYLRSRHWAEAKEQAEQVWSRFKDPAFAVPLVISTHRLGDQAGAAEILQSVHRHADATNAAEVRMIEWLGRQIYGQ